MADGCVQVSSTKSNPNEWKFDEILRYKEQECFAYDRNRIKWTDSYDMLKIFMKCGIEQTGVWSSPGGKYKKFVSSNSDLVVSWNYERGLLSFQGKTGDRLRDFLINICTSKPVFCTSSEAVALNTTCVTASINNILVYDGHKERNAIGTLNDCGKASPNSDSVSSTLSCKNPMLEELQNFIDESSLNVLSQNNTDNMLSAHAVDSSTPLRTQADSNLSAVEQQFIIFKENIEAKVSALTVKSLEQSKIIHNTKQELCKLTKENFNLKSRLAMLEEKVFPESEFTVPIDPGSIQQSIVHKVIPASTASPPKALSSPILYEIKERHNPQNEIELITAENNVKQGKPKALEQGKPKDLENHRVKTASNDLPITKTILHKRATNNVQVRQSQKIPVLITNRRFRKKSYPKHHRGIYDQHVYQPRFFRNQPLPWRTDWQEYLKFVKKTLQPHHSQSRLHPNQRLAGYRVT